MVSFYHRFAHNPNGVPEMPIPYEAFCKLFEDHPKINQAMCNLGPKLKNYLDNRFDLSSMSSSQYMNKEKVIDCWIKCFEPESTEEDMKALFNSIADGKDIEE
jgi:hypothetical protein